MTRIDRINNLISLDEKINNELFLFQQNLDEIFNGAPDEERHRQCSSRILHIQSLFDHASDIIRDLSLVDSDVHFYEALQAKDRISTNYIRFNRMKSQVERFFNKSQQHDLDSLEREFHTVQQNVDEFSEEKEDVLNNDNEPSDAFLFEGQFMEDEKKSKKKKSSVNKHADAESLRHTEEQYNQNYQSPYDYSGERPERPVTSADLRDEQFREEEKRAAERERDRAKRREMHEKFIAYQDEHRPKDLPPSNQDTQNFTPIYNTPENISPSSSRPERPVTSADLRDKQYREEEKRAAERERDRARREATHEKFAAYQEAQRPSMPQPTNDKPQSFTPIHNTSENISPSSSRPERPVTSADLRDKQYREEEKRAAERERDRAKNQARHEKVAAYQEAQRPSMPQPTNVNTRSNSPSYRKSDTSFAEPQGKAIKPTGDGDSTRQEAHGIHTRRQEGRPSSAVKSTTDIPRTGASTHNSPQAPSHGAVEKPGTGLNVKKYSEGNSRATVNARTSHLENSRHEISDVRASKVKDITSPKRFTTPEHGRKSAQSSVFSGKDSSFVFTPSGVVSVKPSQDRSNRVTSSGSFQGVHTGNSIKSSSKEKAPAVSSGEKRNAVRASDKSFLGRSDQKRQITYNHFGYMPTGVFGFVSTNGSLSRNHTTYKASNPVSSSSGKLKTVSNGRTLNSGILPKRKGMSANEKTPLGAWTQGQGLNAEKIKKSGCTQSREPHKPIFGTTGQPRRGNANKANKNTVKETSAGFRKKGNHLRSRAIAASYAKATGIRVARYMGGAMSTGARKLYQMLQEGDNNVLRGFESTRYYGSVGFGVAKALATRNAPRKMVEKVLGEKFKNRRAAKKYIKKELPGELKNLKKQGKELKKKIKELQKKGSSLSLAERQKLLQLKNEHKALGKNSKKFGKAQKKFSRNSMAIKNGLFALQRALISSLGKGDDIGMEGVAKALSFTTNHHVHRLVKGTVRATWNVSKFVARGTKLVAKGAKSIATKIGNKATKKATQTLVKTGRTAGQMTSRYVQRKVKTAGSKAATAGAKKAAAGIAAGAKKLAVGVKSLISVIIKGLGTKAGAIIGLVIVLVAAVGSFLSSITSTSSTLILSPDTSDDGKIDLSAYCAIIEDEWTLYKLEVWDDVQEEYAEDDIERVKVEAGEMPGNAREILSMMAVRMSQDLDLEENDEIDPYIRYLVRQLNPYTTMSHTYSCSGCETKFERGEAIFYCPGGHVEIIVSFTSMHFDSDDSFDDPIFSMDEMASDDADAVRGGIIHNFEITYYAPTGNPTATGTEPQAGRTIAVDPNIIPLGSHVIIDGHEYVAEDTGGAITGYIIDIFVDSEAEAIEKGHRYDVPVYRIVYEGEDIMDTGIWDGWTEGNIKWCKLIYSMNWNQLYTGFGDFIGGMVPGDDLIVSGDWVWPVSSTNIRSEFGWRIHPVYGTRKFHNGVDIGVSTGTPVCAAGDGTVTISKYSDTAGNYITIDHGDGITTVYMHNSVLCVGVGNTVRAGQVIAYSGNTGTSTGPHLHFEFRVGGSPINPRTQYGL